MQNKGLIKFFTILFVIVSIYQISFTYFANNVAENAKKFANGNTTKELAYLDSIGSKKVMNLGFTDFTYNEVKSKQINKGLDLEGGINVMLQISVKDILKGLANNSKNTTFNNALKNATVNQEGNQDYLDAFYVAFENESKGKLKLASSEVFYNKVLKDIVKSDMTDDQVKKIIKDKVQKSLDSAFDIIRNRIDRFGVVQPNIQKIGESGRILVELPGAKDIDRIEKLLVGTAKLEFWETIKPQQLQDFLTQTNDLLKKEVKVTTTETAKPTTTTADTTKTKETSAAELLAKDKPAATPAKTEVNPLAKLFVQTGNSGAIAAVKIKDTAKVNAIFNRSDVRALLQGEVTDAKFVWGKTKSDAPEYTELFVLKGNPDNIAPISGDVVDNAQSTYSQLGDPQVNMRMNATGARKWEQLTNDVNKQGNQIAIVLDNLVQSAPGVSIPGGIAGGSSEITGNFTIEETTDLENALNSGKLPATAEIIQKEIVGASLGQEAIDAGTISSIIGLLIVSLWMVFYYGKAGWYANAALAINLILIFGAMASFPGGFVLTLPGIAGIVLTMGTAVDANIIIYERAKEELRAGKTLAESVNVAFGWKGAMRSIVDANVTHVLTGLILLIFGNGPIRGFAVTLLIGIFTSLFTSIFIARFFIDKDIAANRELKFSTNITKNWFTGFHFDFLKIKKFTYAFSLVVCAVSIFSFFTNGFDQGIDFVGGRTFQVQFDKKVSTEELTKVLSSEAVFGSVEVKTIGNNNQVKITTKYKIEEGGAGVDKEINEKLFNAVKGFFAKPINYEEFTTTREGKVNGVVQAMKVGPTVAKDIKNNAFWAVIGAMLVVCLYLVVSFRKYQYSLGAIAAVAHDVIFVLGIYSIFHKILPFHMQIDQHFIAAILTVIGYSMNDTVIVFDRVREFLGGKSHHGNFNKIVNDSINTTLSRTLNTSLTMILVLTIMFVFGGDSIRGFIFAMLVGIIVGTYSSLFIATPVLVDTISAADKEQIEKEHNV